MKIRDYLMGASLALAAATSVSAAAASPPAYMAHGRVDAVDTATGTVKLTHSAIPSLGWPGMTMRFPLKDRALAKQLSVGEQVDFDLAQFPQGYEITRIAPVGGNP